MAREFQWMSQTPISYEQFVSLRDQALTKEEILGRLASAIGIRPTKNLQTLADLEAPILLRQNSAEKNDNARVFHPLTVVAGAKSMLAIRYCLDLEKGVRPVLVPLGGISQYGLVPSINNHGTGFFVTGADASESLGIKDIGTKKVPVLRDDRGILGPDFGDYHDFFSGR